MRWRQDALETQVLQDLERMRLDAEAATWFRDALGEGFRDEETMRRDRRGRWAKRQSEVKGMLERLLDGYLGGVIEEAVFREKSVALKAEEAELAERLAGGTGNGSVAGAGEWAVAVLDFTQKATEMWHGSTFGVKRDILDCLWSNRTLSDVSLTLTRRKPFDILVEGPFSGNGGGYRGRTHFLGRASA